SFEGKQRPDADDRGPKRRYEASFAAREELKQPTASATRSSHALPKPQPPSHPEARQPEEIHPSSKAIPASSGPERAQGQLRHSTRRHRRPCCPPLQPHLSPLRSSARPPQVQQCRPNSRDARP